MREFLKGLDLDKETIDTIMAEHGKYLTGLKEQNDTYKQEVEDYKKQVTKLNGQISEKDKSLENLQTLTNENKELKAQVQMNGSNVKKEFSKFVTSEVMANVDDKTDFATALENYKKDNPQYFGDTLVKKVQSSPNLTNGVQPITTDSIMNEIIRGEKN